MRAFFIHAEKTRLMESGEYIMDLPMALGALAGL